MSVNLAGNGRRIGQLVLCLAILGSTAGSVVAQDTTEKTFSEKAKEYWDKIVKGMEAGASAYGAEFSKMKAEAGRLTGKAKDKMSAEMEVLGKKWSDARAKLGASIEKHMASVGQEILDLEAKTAKATGPAREKLMVEAKKLKAEMIVARDKISSVWSSNMKAVGEEYAHLSEEASKAASDAKEKLKPRLEQLKAEWTKNKEKVTTYLKEDLEQTKKDLESFGEATTNSAKVAKQTLESKYAKLKAKLEEMTKKQSIEEEVEPAKPAAPDAAKAESTEAK